jgi:alpha-L-rhamnosidase
MKTESIESRGYTSPSKWTWHGDVDFTDGFKLSNHAEGYSEITFDYERAEGGLPFIDTTEIVSNGELVEVGIIFSETYDGIQSRTGINESSFFTTHSSQLLGDGPFFLFSNAMDTYRINTQYFEPSTAPSLVKLRFAQRSQRYQKIILKTPNSSLTISHLGFTHIRPPNPTKSTFICSNDTLNRIWNDGVRTVDMCTVEAGETANAWEVTESGTRIRGQHWAPCRHGTRWGDKIVSFEVQIEHGGASWGVHMVANGLIFCLDSKRRTLGAFEGLSEANGVFPSVPRGRWDISPDISLGQWILVKMTAKGSSVSVQLNGAQVALVSDLDIHPILGGSGNNTGSVAFGGPEEYKAIYRALYVTDLEGKTLYQNNLKFQDQARTFADFAVGTNALSCTIDGAKRDRALFGGDLFVMGRSMYYSTANLNAALGSIKLLASHQTKDGYLGNLCPIQAPAHEDLTEPPTYAFYSLSYALLLVVAIKDYWLHSGDITTVRTLWQRLEKLIAFTESFVDERGLVVAPPLLSSTFSTITTFETADKISGLVSNGWTHIWSFWQD